MDKQLTIEIDIGQQRLVLKEGNTVLHEYPVSTAKNGPGERQDSECTPRGQHVIAEKIGAGCAVDTVFVSRRPTGEIYSPRLRQEQPGRDWILTRILWLRGNQPGINQGDAVDSYHRFIYIHGSPDDVAMGKPGSRGCIRMRNRDVIELFDQVETGTPVNIC
ncbi:MAG TPA: L,D-transpeptidase [Gammaproteobacteria bacterium]|nr:L,D-transpeptidase [Gammaproteobacteria bacterium]